MTSAENSRALTCGLILAGALTLSHAGARAEELSIQADGKAVRLTISGEDGKEYSLESVEALLNQNANWRPVATVAPGRKPAFVFDPTCSTRPQNFYRLRLLQGTIPVYVPNFRLLDLQGQARELFYESDARAVVLLFAGPTLSSLDPAKAELQQLAQGVDGVRFWIVATSTSADHERLRQEAEALGSGFTVLEDEAGVVTAQFCRGTVPEAVVFDPANYSIIYRGRVSDALPCATGVPQQALLKSALEDHLAGRGVVIRDTPPIGSPAVLPTMDQITYEKDIAPILQGHCVKCHSPGNIAPWAMTNHAVVRDFAPLIKDEILTRRMPPWHADRRAQHYSNDEMLSGLELATLVHWIDRGAPGDPSAPDPLAEHVPPPPPEWPLGQPDRILSIEPQQIPANGTVDYRYLIIPNPYTTDVWLRAAVLRPGNRRAVHHVLVFSATSLTDILEVQAGLGGYFAAYVPGLDQVEYPTGTGKLLKKGAFLVFQMHYTATGQPETDSTSIGLYTLPTPPERELKTGAAYTLQFTIPPGSQEQPAVAEFTMQRDGTLYELSPHMHYRGKWFRFEALYPDGSRETLLNVPFYRFDWQSLYRLEEPRHLPAGTKIVATGAWDNSIKNPYNPDPSATVYFGEQSWEEMFIGYFNWAPTP